jgi:predicted ATPase
MTALPPLSRIEITGYKSIRELDLELRPLNILIGANGSGKSNFISAFKLLNHIVERRLQFFVAQAGGADNLLYFGAQTTDVIKIKLEFGANGYECTLAPTPKEHLFFAEERCWFHNPKYPDPYIIHLVGVQGETGLDEEAQRHPNRTANYVQDALKNWKVYHFHDTSDTAKVKKTVNINDNAALRADASNLAAFLYLLQERHPDHYRRIVGTVRLVAPFFDDFILRPNPLNPDTIQLEWREKGSDAYFNANMLSDGTLRFICLTTLLLQPEELLPATILIDEPELGLHPYAIAVLAAMLRSIATVKRKVIASTQSVTFMNEFGYEDLVVSDRLGGQSTFRRPTYEGLKDWLDEYTLGELWEKNVLGGRP